MAVAEVLAPVAEAEVAVAIVLAHHIHRDLGLGLARQVGLLGSSYLVLLAYGY